jgi:hypothetical protein
MNIAVISGMLFTCPNTSIAASIVDTTLGWTGTGEAIYNSSTLNQGRYGQVFTVPQIDTVLQSVQFYLGQGQTLNPVSYTLNVATWNPVATIAPSGAVTYQAGNLLFSSQTFSTAGLPRYDGTVNGYVPITFDFGQLALSANQPYIAYLNVISSGGEGVVGLNLTKDFHPDAFATFGYQPDGSWYTILDNGNGPYSLAFKATFTSVPEPGATVGTIFFVVILAAVRRRVLGESKSKES